MKTIFRTSRPVLIWIAALALMFNSCKKDEAKPALSELIKGIYNVYSIVYDGQTISLPSNGDSMTLEIIKVDENSVRLLETDTFSGTTDSGDWGVDFILTDAGNGLVNIMDGTDKIGIAGNNTMTLDFTDSSAKRTVIKSRR
jgi:hypothetical protein